MRLPQLCIIVASVALTGCQSIQGSIYGDNGLFHDRSSAYRTAANGPNLKVPAPLSDEKIAHYFYLKPGQPIADVAMLPPGSLAYKVKTGQVVLSKQKPQRANSQLAQVQKTKDRTQLVVAEAMPQAWQSVVKAVKNAGLPIVQEKPRQHRLYILDTTTTNNKVTQATPIYRIALQTQSKQTIVNLTTQHGQALPSNVNDHLLQQLANTIQATA